MYLIVSLLLSDWTIGVLSKTTSTRTICNS